MLTFAKNSVYLERNFKIKIIFKIVERDQRIFSLYKECAKCNYNFHSDIHHQIISMNSKFIELSNEILSLIFIVSRTPRDRHREERKKQTKLNLWLHIQTYYVVHISSPFNEQNCMVDHKTFCTGRCSREAKICNHSLKSKFIGGCQ